MKAATKILLRERLAKANKAIGQVLHAIGLDATDTLPGLGLSLLAIGAAGYWRWPAGCLVAGALLLGSRILRRE